MRTRFLIFMALNALLWGCASFPQCERGTGMGKGEPPVIFDSHAASAIRLGGTWRIYLHAKDADGDMRFLVAIINQTGVASYPTSFTPVKEEDSREVAGYLFLNTSARDRNLINDRLTLTLFVRDCQGNRSAPVDFPLRFGFTSPEKTPAKWEASANRSLGPIMIDIEPSVRSRPFRGL